MIDRDITPFFIRHFAQYPIVTLTGPRQSGKTTLCRMTFPELSYSNLEAPDQRSFAESDPRGFLQQLGSGAIIDEVQRVPQLLSYLQVLVDEKGHSSQFILTGSENLRLSDAISQSLAGRTSLLRLMPFSVRERYQTGASNAVEDVLYSGFYPRIFDQSLEPREVYGDYFETYVERDVRQLTEIRNQSSFRRFVGLCAGQVGQLTDFVKLGSNAGVSHTTARQWFELLEASFIAFRLQPFQTNIRKRLVKSPKIYFYDVGLASYLIGIERPDQLIVHPLKGALFENMVIVEAMKNRYNRARRSNLSFFRDSRGLECDLLYDVGNEKVAIEIKSGATIPSDVFVSLKAVRNLIPNISNLIAVYGGQERQSRSEGTVIPFEEFSDVLERLEINEEVTGFVKTQLKSTRLESDVSILDAVVRRFIQPTIREVANSFHDSDLAQLYEKLQHDSSFTFADIKSDSFSLMDSGYWENLRREFNLNNGFRLDADNPAAFTHQITLFGHRETKSDRSDFAISLDWVLDHECVTQCVTVNGEIMTKLSDRILYSELHSRRPKFDRICSEIGRAILNTLKKEQ